MKLKDGEYALTISRCPIHGYQAITLDGNGHGVRLTPSKCCGRWDTVTAWKLSPNELRRAADQFSRASQEAVVL